MNETIEMRWSPCWYGQAIVNRLDTGSIPVTAAWRALEAIRLDEEPASKAGAGAARCGFESHGFRLRFEKYPGNWRRVMVCCSRQKSGPVVQRRRLLAYNQKTMVRVHPGLIDTCALRGHLVLEIAPQRPGSLRLTQVLNRYRGATRTTAPPTLQWRG